MTAASHQALRRLRLGPRPRGLDQAKAQGQAQSAAKSPSISTAPAWCPSARPSLSTAARSIWVIRGEVMCRQRIRDVRPFRDKDGIGRCALVLDPKVVLVEPRPYRAFQGWRYLAAKDAPRDLDKAVQRAPPPCRRRCAGSCANSA